MFKRHMAAFLVALHVIFVAQIPMANAAMIGTPQVLHEQQQQVDRQQLLSMLDDQQAQQRLQEMGVDREQVEARINSLTSAELAQFNERLANEPAGASVAGVIVLFLLVFIVTDILCVTDIFSFIKCLR